MLSSALSKSCFRVRIGLLITLAVCLVEDLGRERLQKKAEKEEITKEESAMSDAVLQELKSLRSDLTQQIVMNLQLLKAALTPESPKLKELFQRLMKLTT